VKANTFYLILGLLFAGYIFYITLRRRIIERDSIVWLIGCVVVLVLSIFPGILGTVAGWVGIEYPPALLFLCATLFLVAMILRLSSSDSEKQTKISELAQRIAILEEELRRREDNKNEQDR